MSKIVDPMHEMWVQCHVIGSALKKHSPSCMYTPACRRINCMACAYTFSLCRINYLNHYRARPSHSVVIIIIIVHLPILLCAIMNIVWNSSDCIVTFCPKETQP